MTAELAAHPDWAARITADHGHIVTARFNPAEQDPMKPRRNNWLKHNPDDPDVKWALDTFADGIDRTNLRRLATGLLDSPRARRRLLVVTLMWGAGTTNRHYGNHHRALNHPDLDAVLRDTIEQIRDRNLEAAWARATDFHGHGMRYPFFTKWLWIVGTTTARRVSPLTYDDNVITSLRYTLNWPWHERGSNTRKRWIAYCRDAAAVADQLDVTSEWVEYWLFCGAPTE